METYNVSLQLTVTMRLQVPGRDRGRAIRTAERLAREGMRLPPDWGAQVGHIDTVSADVARVARVVPMPHPWDEAGRPGFRLELVSRPGRAIGRDWWNRERDAISYAKQSGYVLEGGES